MIAQFPQGFGVAAEWGKGKDFHQLNRQDPEQAEGPMHFDVQAAAATFDGLDPDAHYGYVRNIFGTPSEQARRDAVQHDGELFARGQKVESDLLFQRPSLTPHRVVLICFGGRRRRGDIVDHALAFIDSVDWKFKPHVAILDLVHGQHHDAARGALVFWLRRIRGGQVVVTFKSPPCETWTIARHNADADATVVPVRSGSEPWGLKALTLRQYNQVTIGSFLLFASLAIMTLCVLTGNAACMEHPAYLDERFQSKHAKLDAASVWRLSEMLRILRLPIGQLNLVLQKNYGMPAVKPTHFASWRLSTIDMRLEQHKAPVAPGAIKPLQGRKSDGTFATAVAKEYPSQLCKALAHAMIDRAQWCEACAEEAPAIETDLTFEDAIAPFIVPLVDEGEGVSFGDDFVDTGPLPILALPRFD